MAIPDILAILGILTWPLTTILIFIVFVIIIAWLLGAVFLGIGLGFVGGKHREFGTVMITVLIGAIVGWIPCLGCILYWYFIKIRHETDWVGAIAAWLIAGLIPLLIAIALFGLILVPFLL